MRIIVFALSLFIPSAALAETAFVVASQDNSIFSDGDGTLSNGSGRFLFAGRTMINTDRRALIAFKDLSAIPAGATIESVKLHLTMNKQNSPATNVRLLRLSSDWGEGASDASGVEGMGAPAQTGDATWLHTFFDQSTWTTPGGDFAAAASANLVIDDVGDYTFGSTAAMISDVQGWLDDPAGNFGWILVADETTTSARRFTSRENDNEENRPTLEVVYSTTDTFRITAGVNDAWFNPLTNGQGFFITVYEDIDFFFIAWFTYDTERPPGGTPSRLGEPGHRWITGQGSFAGDTATLDVVYGTGGVFDSGEPEVSFETDGTMVVEFSDCENGLVTYDIESLNLRGSVPIQRVATGNVPLCETLSAR